ncbi:sugar-binding transcriptional regulator [Aliiroseovarius sp. PTFE2010]|uniref:sugar-binding transcriptional regulator n=1 Tax=Aliiroseovarius sp. PTFE2010 TaxID=3417190 RepID=UPI003CF3D135
MAAGVGDEDDVPARDLAVRAAWMSLVGGLTQDQIARELGISRQRAQRLYARAQSEGLVRVRIEHPVAECLELERALKSRFHLSRARVSPSIGPQSDVLPGLAAFAAPALERIFQADVPSVVALGTGRTLRMVIDRMLSLDGSQHKLVSLIGNVAPDGSGSFYEVIFRLAEKTNAPHYPMSAPVFSTSLDERDLYRSLPHVSATMALARSADLAIVGIGQMDETAPLLVDRFISHDDLRELMDAGAVGEICGQVFDGQGNLIDHPVNDWSVGIVVPGGQVPLHCIAGGPSKLAALRAALAGNLLDALTTDETTARALLG